MFTAFLIKYAEIGIKGKNRYLFEDALVQQIKYALKKCEGEFKIHKTQGRIFVDALTEFDFDETVENLKKVFGISGICPVVSMEDEGFEKLCENVLKYIDDVYPDKNMTFKVHARRARKNFPKDSMTINMEMSEFPSGCSIPIWRRVQLSWRLTRSPRYLAGWRQWLSPHPDRPVLPLR